VNSKSPDMPSGSHSPWPDVSALSTLLAGQAWRWSA
jgi:hypothetical protein